MSVCRRRRVLARSAARSTSSSAPGSVPAGVEVGGLSDVLGLLWTHVWISVLALAASVAVALPFGVWFGHRGSGEGFAVAIGNAGRAIPELGLIAIVAAFIGVGVFNLTIALLVLGIPPILTNAFVGIRQVDRDAVEAARGIGMTEWEVIRKVELPLAVPTIMAGVRTGAINIIATATIAPLVGVRDARRLHHQRLQLTGPRACSPGRSWSRCWRSPSSSPWPESSACSPRAGSSSSARPPVQPS